MYSQKEFEPLAWDFYKCIFEICNGKNSQDSRKFHSTGLRPKFKPRNVIVLMRRNTKLDQEWYSVMVHDLFYHVSEMTAITLPLVLESQGYVNSRELILKYDQQPELYQPTRLTILLEGPSLPMVASASNASQVNRVKSGSYLILGLFNLPQEVLLHSYSNQNRRGDNIDNN